MIEVPHDKISTGNFDAFTLLILLPGLIWKFREMSLKCIKNLNKRFFVGYFIFQKSLSWMEIVIKRNFLERWGTSLMPTLASVFFIFFLILGSPPPSNCQWVKRQLVSDMTWDKSALFFLKRKKKHESSCVIFFKRKKNYVLLPTHSVKKKFAYK